MGEAMADEQKKKTPPHIPRGQVPEGRVPTGRVPRGQIEIVAPPGSENVVRCKKCDMAMNWDPALNQWYCQGCMIYYGP